MNKKALRDALDQIAWLNDWQPRRTKKNARPSFLDDALYESQANNPNGTTRILGASFSGSLPSIRNTLEQWCRTSLAKPQKTTIRMFSGTATAIPPVGESIESGTCHINPVDALLIDEVTRLGLMLHDLELGVSNIVPTGGARHLKQRIAVLRENTSYGAAVSAELPGHANVIDMPFPLHISDLRTAYSQAELPRTSTSPPLSRRNIPENDKNDRENQDVIPAFSSRSPSYQELVVARLMTAISRSDTRYVGISATDVEDLVFLAARVRECCPEAIIFTTSADLRFIHSDVNPDLYGTLVFSTYPLFGPNQLWTYPYLTNRGSPHYQFPSENAQGIFNATLKLLEGPNEHLYEHLYEHSPPFTEKPDLPALWVSVVGRDQIWPLGFHELGPGKEKPSDMRIGDFYPRSLIFIFVLLGVGWIVLSVRLFIPAFEILQPCNRWLYQYMPTWLVRMTENRTPFEELASERRLRLATLSVGLVTTFVVGQGFFWLPYRWLPERWLPHSTACPLQDRPGIWVYFGLAFEALTAIFLLSALTGAFWKILQNRKSFKEYGGTLAVPRLLVSITLSFIVLFFGIRLVWWIWHRPAHFIMFDFLRAIHPSNGVSPLKPLIFLGVAAVALTVCQLRRLALLEDLRIEPPFLGFEQGSASFRGTQALEKQVVGYLAGPWIDLPGSYWFLGLSVPLCWYYLLEVGLPWGPSLWIDGRWFEWFYIFISVFLYFNLSLLLLRFFWIWIALHQLLRRLYFHPTRGAYETLRTKSLPIPPTELHIRLREPASSLSPVEYCLERARDLLKIAGDAKAGSAKTAAKPSPLAARIFALSPVLGCFIRLAEADLSELGNYGEDWAGTVKMRAVLQRDMSYRSTTIARVFDRAWRLESQKQPAMLINTEGDKTTDRRLLDEAELFVASRVVDFLRKVYPQMLNLVWFVIGGMLAMMLAASSYPFPALDTVLWLAWAVLLSAIGVSIGVFVSINMSRIVSMLRGTEPGRFNWDWAFTTHLLVLGVLPIMAMIGAQYPHTLNNVISWIGGIFGGGQG
ncbi:MAG: hypothetical protein ACLQU2_04570 [Candidatus Binataceae bacterium]